MLKKASSLLNNVKDQTLSFAMREFVNYKIKEYGAMLKLNLDSEKKSIEMEVMLDGEKEPLTVSVDRYTLIQKGERHFLQIEGISTSRAWINTVASSYLEGQRFEIPAEYAKMLKIIV